MLLVQNRISTRRAAVLSYLGQTLLRTLPAVEDELDRLEPKQQIIFHLPRPKRDDPVVECQSGSAPAASSHAQPSGQHQLIASPQSPAISREAKTPSHFAASVPGISSSPLSPDPSSPDSSHATDMPASPTPPHLLPGFGKPANWDALIPRGRALRRRQTPAKPG